MQKRCCHTCTFQSTLPVRGATERLYSGCSYTVISIHAPRAGSDNSSSPCRCRLVISIHAPRAGSDLRDLTVLRLSQIISIHAPRAGSDQAAERLWNKYLDFNPRSPCGERPSVPHRGNIGGIYFNPRSPCGERHTRVLMADGSEKISIHAPRAGSDSNILCFCKFKAQYILNQLF